MTDLNEAAIERIASKFLDRSLSKSEWSHAAHFAVALWLLRAGRAAELPERIRAYNAATGVANTATSGYHATITRASLVVAAAALANARDAPLSTILATLLATRYCASNWPLTHWSRDRLFAPEARADWVEPDLLPLESW